jgi:hypothetical protein
MESEYARLSNAEEDHILTDQDMYFKARKSGYKIPPLIHAIGTKNKNAMRMLLYDEYDLIKPDLPINQKDIIGDTPLIKAVRTGQLRIVSDLLGEDDIDIDAKNVSGHTALDLANAYNHLEINAKNDSEPTALDLAKAHNRLEIVKLLEDKKNKTGRFQLGKISLDYGGKRKHRKKKTSKKTRKTSKKTRKGRSIKHKK